MSPQQQPRLSEQDLAQLYRQTAAPWRLDDLLQNRAEGNDGQVAVHDSLTGQTPDLALISLSLCGLIVARDFPVELKDAHAGPVLRELVMACDENLLTVGRLWLDTVCHGIAPARADRETIKSIPDGLRILLSIFQELRDVLDGHENRPMRDALKSLYYQAESHADLADRFVAELTAAAKKAKPGKPVKRPAVDTVPLPFDLSRPRQPGGADIVAFSLFRPKGPTKTHV